jgi:hypothetical protein
LNVEQTSKLNREVKEIHGHKNYTVH